MRFFKVWVRSQRYHGKEALTYSYSEDLPLGTIVKVPLQSQSVLGFISEAVSKPTFATKSLTVVPDVPPLPAETLPLAEWMLAFYASSVGVITPQFLPVEIMAKHAAEPTQVAKPTQAAKLPPLTTEQTAALKQIYRPDTYLMHGKTGTGKTRLYIELARRSLDAGKSVTMLSPEISLTSQLARNFMEIFGERVVILHSQLTPAERQKAWLRILKAPVPLVVIGPRSALFSPLKNIGLIVLDESHETAYKQEQAPYYHAARVASKLAELHHATLVLGSATPSITDYFMAEQRQKKIVRLITQATVTEEAPTEFALIDIKDRSLFTKATHISTPLIDAIGQALQRGEQTMLYLNRRGTARVVLCENCGWQALCPHCDLPLVFHGDSFQLQCHTCGYHQANVTSCPVCSHPSIVFKSVGTKAIVDEIQRLFPEARVQRFDTDNKRAERFEKHYAAVANGEIDILVGTQLLAKGLDLPRLSVLGILMADSSLSLPDFSSQERTYQLLTQVLGRIGRGHRKGYAFIQTYQPAQPILQAAISGEWQNFYAAELSERQKFSFPPFTYLLKLTCRRASYKSAEKAALALKQTIEEKYKTIEVNGPAPSFHEKLQNKFQCQLVLKSGKRSDLLGAINLVPGNGWTYDIDPINLL